MAQAQARRAIGAGDQFKDQVQGTVNKAKNEAAKEGEDLRYAAKEKARREARSEGWRSDAFDV